MWIINQIIWVQALHTPFSSFFYSLLFFILLLLRLFTYFKWRLQPDLGVSILVTAQIYVPEAEIARNKPDKSEAFTSFEALLFTIPTKRLVWYIFFTIIWYFSEVVILYRQNTENPTNQTQLKVNKRCHCQARNASGQGREGSCVLHVCVRAKKCFNHKAWWLK